MKTLRQLKILSAICAFVLFATALPVNGRTLAPQTANRVETIRSSTLAPQIMGAVAVEQSFERNRETLRQMDWQSPAVLNILDTVYIFLGVFLGLTLGPQLLLLLLVPKLAFNLAVLEHGAAHTLLGALGILLSVRKIAEWRDTLHQAKAFVTLSNLTEQIGLKRFLIAFIPGTTFFDNAILRRAGVPVAKGVGSLLVRIQALGGIVLNAAAVGFGIAVLIAAVSQSFVFLIPALVLTAPFIYFNIVSIFASADDWTVYNDEAGESAILRSGLLGAQKVHGASQEHFRKVLESQMRLYPTAWGSQSLGILLSSSGYFCVQTIDNIKHTELVKALHRSFSYLKGVLALSSLRGQRKQLSYDSYVMHLQSLRDSDVEEEEETQPLAGRCNAPYWHWRFDTNGRLSTEKILWTNYITHSGHYEGSTLLGQFRPHAEIRKYLENVLDLYSFDEGDSPVVAMMLDLLITKGSWAKSMRLAFQQMDGRTFEDAFQNGYPADWPGWKKRLYHFSRRFYRRLNALYKWFFSGLQAKFNADQPCGVPNQFVLDDWSAAADQVFARFLVSGLDRFAFESGKPRDLSSLTPQSRSELKSELVNALWNTSAANGWFGNRAQMEEFATKAIQNFCQNDTFVGTQLFMKDAKGSFGLFTGSTSDQAHILTARGQPLSLGFGGEGDKFETATLERRGWASDSAMLNLQNGGNKHVYRWIYHLDDEDGEIVRLGPAFDDFSVYSLSGGEDGKGHLLGKDEVSSRVSDMQNQNELISPPLKLLNGKDPLQLILDEYPQIIKKIRTSWKEPQQNQPPSYNRRTAEALLDKLKIKAQRLHHTAALDSNLQSKTSDMIILGDGHNLLLAQEFEKRMQALFPDLTIHAIDAYDFGKNPKKYVPGVDADTLVVALGHSSRRTATYQVARQLKIMQDQVSRNLNGNAGIEGGLFVLSSRWDTELTHLAGIDPAKNQFQPAVISTYSGKTFAPPETHAPAFMATWLELEHYLGRGLLKEARDNKEAMGERPLGMNIDYEEMEEVHNFGMEMLEKHIPEFSAEGMNEKDAHRALTKIGAQSGGFSLESPRTIFVGLALVALSLLEHFPLPFSLLYKGVITPLFPQIGAFVFMGVTVAPLVFAIFDIIFFEYFVHYVAGITRFLSGHPVMLSKGGMKQLYIRTSGGYGGPLVLSFIKKTFDNIWPLNQFKVALLSRTQEADRQSVVLSSVPFYVQPTAPSKKIKKDGELVFLKKFAPLLGSALIILALAGAMPLDLCGLLLIAHLFAYPVLMAWSAKYKRSILKRITMTAAMAMIVFLLAGTMPSGILAVAQLVLLLSYQEPVFYNKKAVEYTFGGPSSEDVAMHVEFGFSREVARQYQKYNPTDGSRKWSENGRRLFDDYDAMLRNFGYMVVGGTMKKRVTTFMASLNNLGNGLSLSIGFVALVTVIIMLITTTGGIFVAANVPYLLAVIGLTWFILFIGRKFLGELKHHENPETRSEPTFLPVFTAIFSGAVAFGVIKGVIKTTLFSSANLPTTLILVGTLVGIVIIFGLSIKIKSELKLFWRYFVRALIPSRTKAVKEGIVQYPDYEKVEALLKETSYSSRASRGINVVKQTGSVPAAQVVLANLPLEVKPIAPVAAPESADLPTQEPLIFDHVEAVDNPNKVLYEIFIEQFMQDWPSGIAVLSGVCDWHQFFGEWRRRGLSAMPLFYFLIDCGILNDESIITTVMENAGMNGENLVNAYRRYIALAQNNSLKNDGLGNDQLRVWMRAAVGLWLIKDQQHSTSEPLNRGSEAMLGFYMDGVRKISQSAKGGFGGPYVSSFFKFLLTDPGQFNRPAQYEQFLLWKKQQAWGKAMQAQFRETSAPIAAEIHNIQQAVSIVDSYIGKPVHGNQLPFDVSTGGINCVTNYEPHTLAVRIEFIQRHGIQILNSTTIRINDDQKAASYSLKTNLRRVAGLWLKAQNGQPIDFNEMQARIEIIHREMQILGLNSTQLKNLMVQKRILPAAKRDEFLCYLMGLIGEKDIFAAA